MTSIRFKQSGTPSAIPPLSSLVEGEIALNIPDGKLYYLSGATNTIEIITNPTVASINNETLEGTGDILTALPEVLSTKALAVHTHTPGDIIESETSTFATDDFVETLNQAGINASAISDRILGIRSLTPTGKIRMSDLSEELYLSQLIDNATVNVKDGKLSVDSIEGMTISKDEFNSLTGVSSHILERLQDVTTFSSFLAVVKTHADLLLVTSKSSDLCIVETDETHGGISTTYMFNGSEWVFNGVYVGGELRDFTKDPIDLSTEVTGVLSNQVLAKQTAIQTYITDKNAVGAGDVDNALILIKGRINAVKEPLVSYFGGELTTDDNVTTSLSKIESIISLSETELTQKGVDTTGMVLDTLSNKIQEVVIEIIPGVVYNTEPVVITAGSKMEVVFRGNVKLNTLCITACSVISGDATLFNKSFLNGYDGYTVNDIMGINASGIYPIIVFKYVHTTNGDKYNAIVDRTPQTIIF